MAAQEPRQGQGQGRVQVGVMVAVVVAEGAVNWAPLSPKRVSGVGPVAWMQCLPLPARRFPRPALGAPTPSG